MVYKISKLNFVAINSSFKSVRDYDSDAADIYPVFYEIFHCMNLRYITTLFAVVIEYFLLIALIYHVTLHVYSVITTQVSL